MLLNAPPAFHLHVCAKDGREGGESCQVCVTLTIFSLLGTWRQGGGPVLAEVVLFVLAERFPKKKNGPFWNFFGALVGTELLLERE